MIEQVEKLIQQGFWNIEVNSLHEIYQAVFSKTFCLTCSSDVVKAFNDLQLWYNSQLNKNQIQAMAKEKQLTHELNNVEVGGYLLVKGIRKQITHENLTQQDIDKILKMGDKKVIDTFLKPVATK